MSESNYTQPDLLLLGEDHIRAYRETGGEVGYIWNGAPTLLLTAPVAAPAKNAPRHSFSGVTPMTI